MRVTIAYTETATGSYETLNMPANTIDDITPDAVLATITDLWRKEMEIAAPDAAPAVLTLKGWHMVKNTEQSAFAFIIEWANDPYFGTHLVVGTVHPRTR